MVQQVEAISEQGSDIIGSTGWGQEVLLLFGIAFCSAWEKTRGIPVIGLLSKMGCFKVSEKNVSGKIAVF